MPAVRTAPVRYRSRVHPDHFNRVFEPRLNALDDETARQGRDYTNREFMREIRKVNDHFGLTTHEPRRMKIPQGGRTRRQGRRTLRRSRTSVGTRRRR